MSEDKPNDEEHELEKIRMKKMQALMEAKKRQEQAQNQVSSIYQKIEYVLRAVLSPDAYSHLNRLKENEQKVYNYIINELITPDVIQSIDYLVSVISQRGGVPRRIPRDVIIFLERQAKGIKGKIQVKRGDGDMMDLGSYLTKD
ncbi:MAG: hypothetical protein EU544_01190 [Promethearchaeota archaeon]|nr:MAG: hypothetical protein EU544_01190 [Candidatus Lokiarchaeota archaeon]